MAEDVTEKRVLAKQLLEAQKFEAIGQLAGGIAHDFNNMIGAILGWAELGRDESEAESRLQRHFDKIRQQAHRAAALTRQLLAFARRQILEPRDMDLNHFAAETLSLLEKVIGSNIEVRTQLAPEGQRAGRPHAGRADSDESVFERSRRHAGRRAAGDRDEQRRDRRGFLPLPAASSSGAIRTAVRLG
jgi:signal transduction histidine kinase